MEYGRSCRTVCIVATFACAAPEDSGGNNNQDASGMPDSGNPQADGGGVDGGCVSLYTQQPVPCSGLNIQYVRRAVNGRYTVQGSMGIKVAVLEAAACTGWVYPVTEFCLRNSLETESGVLSDLSTSGCMTPLDESGKCTDEYRRRDNIWLCDCNKIVGQTHDEAWPGTPGFLEWCQSWHHPSRPDCDEGGVTVEAAISYSGLESVESYHKFLAHE